MSDVSELRERIREEYEASVQGLNGLASVAKHKRVDKAYTAISVPLNELELKIGRTGALSNLYHIIEETPLDSNEVREIILPYIDPTQILEIKKIMHENGGRVDLSGKEYHLIFPLGTKKVYMNHNKSAAREKIVFPSGVALVYEQGILSPTGKWAKYPEIGRI